LKQVNATINRWLVVAGAILNQLAMSAIYAWSVPVARLTDQGGAYQFTASQTAWVFAGHATRFRINQADMHDNGHGGVVGAVRRVSADLAVQFDKRSTNIS